MHSNEHNIFQFEIINFCILNFWHLIVYCMMLKFLSDNILCKKNIVTCFTLLLKNRLQISLHKNQYTFIFYRFFYQFFKSYIHILESQNFSIL